MKTLFVFFVLAGFGFPAWLYFQSGFLIWGIACGIAGIIWVLATQFGWRADPAAGLVLGMAANAVATWLYPQSNALILSALFTLAAWDLASFRRRLLLANPLDDMTGLIWRHVRGLLLFLFCAAILSLIAVWFPLKLEFWPGVVLMVICFVGLVQLIRRLLAVGRTPDRQH